jgi:chromosome segregation ATPase
MPSEIVSLEESLAALRAQQATTSANPSLALPLPATLDLISQRQAELDQLNQQLKILTHAVPRKTRELERLQSELRPLEMQRAGTVAAAREAQRRKEEGERGIGDDLEMKGRWYRSVEAGLKDMLNTMA